MSPVGDDPATDARTPDIESLSLQIQAFTADRRAKTFENQVFFLATDPGTHCAIGITKSYRLGVQVGVGAGGGIERNCTGADKSALYQSISFSVAENTSWWAHPPTGDERDSATFYAHRSAFCRSSAGIEDSHVCTATVAVDDN